jgi:PAS domain-containing protein
MSGGRTFQTVDALPQGFIEVDSQGLITTWNRWLEERTGRSRIEILGHRVDEVYPDAMKLHQAIAAVRATSQPVVRSQLLHQYLLPIPLPKGHFSGFAWMQQECHIVAIEGGHHPRRYLRRRRTEPIVSAESRFERSQERRSPQRQTQNRLP